MAPRRELPIRTTVVAPILRRLAESGHDVAALARELQLPDGAAAEPELVLPLSMLEALWNRAAELANDENFGLNLAVHFPRGTYGLVEFIARNSATLRDGLGRIARYAGLMIDRVEVKFTERAGRGRFEHRPEPHDWQSTHRLHLPRLEPLPRPAAVPRRGAVSPRWCFAGPVLATSADTVRSGMNALARC